jgi:hypothetical protein
MALGTAALDCQLWTVDGWQNGASPYALPVRLAMMPDRMPHTRKSTIAGGYPDSCRSTIPSEMPIHKRSTKMIPPPNTPAPSASMPERIQMPINTYSRGAHRDEVHNHESILCDPDPGRVIAIGASPSVVMSCSSQRVARSSPPVPSSCGLNHQSVYHIPTAHSARRRLALRPCHVGGHASHS